MPTAFIGNIYKFRRSERYCSNGIYSVAYERTIL